MTRNQRALLWFCVVVSTLDVVATIIAGLNVASAVTR